MRRAIPFSPKGLKSSCITMQTIYHIEDHTIMRDAIGMILTRIKPGVKVTGVDRMAALEIMIARQGPPDLFLLDLGLPDTLGLSGLNKLVATYPNIPVVVITGSEEDEDRCMAHGAAGFIGKTMKPPLLIESLRKFLIKEEEELPLVQSGPTKLSKRQKQLIVMLDLGLSNNQIAQKLEISEHTVKVHFWRLFRRLGVNSRTQALHYARENGWLR
jgi:DNA-binding NarL/FixJ family response regulator